MTKENQGRLFGVGVAAVVLGPALITGFASPPALVLQAVTITAISVALLGVSVAVKGWRNVLTADRPTLLALALYSAAAVQGAAVALARANNTALIAGQFLSMILLPLGAAAALGFLRQGDWRPFVTGLVAAAGAGGLVQLIMTVPTAINGPPGFRLMLPNGGSFAGVAPLALFLAGALARVGDRRARALAWAAGAVMLAIILGTGIRSQWLVLPAGVATYAALAAGRARLLSRRTLVIAGPVIFVLGAGVAATTWWWFKSRPSLMPQAPNSAAVPAGEPILFVLPGATQGAIRVEGTLTCQAPGYAYLAVLGAQGSSVPGPMRQFGVTGVGASEFQMVVAPQPAERKLILELTDPQNLGCTASRLRAEVLWPPVLARSVAQLAALVHRPPDPGAGSAPEAFSQDASIAFRLRETRAIASEIRNSAWPLQLLGHGLGATYSIDTLGYDSRGHVQRFKSPNYIHNFYLFLPFKLGLVGTVEALAALGIFVWVAAKGARARPVGTADRRFFAAVAASWITYILWSAAAPEILDFRMAAIWGMLAATTAAARKCGDARRPEV